MKLSKAIVKKWKEPEFQAFISGFERLNANRRQAHETPDSEGLPALQAKLRKLYQKTDLIITDLQAGNASAGILETGDEKFVFRIPTLSPHSIAAFSKCEKLNTKRVPIVTKTNFLIIAESDASIFFPGTKDYKCFSIIEYVENGHLKSNALRESKQNKEAPDYLAKRYQLALTRVLNVAEMLQVMLNNGIIFTDLKPANLLVRDDGKIVISDPKCFFPGTKGNLRKSRANRYLVDCTANNGFICAFSQQYAPDEFNPNNKNVDLERFYCFQLGKILYELATLDFECEIPEINYQDTFFTTPLGSLASRLLHGQIDTLQNAMREFSTLQSQGAIQQVQTSRIPVLSKMPSGSSETPLSAPRQRDKTTLFGSTSIPTLDLRNIREQAASSDDLEPPLAPRASHIESLVELPPVEFEVTNTENPAQHGMKHH